ncbi:MAG: MBL fold metallo-hydrolase [Peptostreptococcus sp.]|uniref:MBL fold metallo-hydrolase n=1 Tax=Peptostreptococcus sp. TaxID=1262 RepID=UPI002FC5E45D
MNKIVMLDIAFQYGDEFKILNPVVLISEKDTVLVDCGYMGFLPLLEEAMLREGIDPSSLTKVVITHHDDDHVGALYELKEKYPNIEVVSSEIESDYIEQSKKSLRLIQAEEMLNEMPEDEKEFGRQFCESLKKIMPVDVDIKVKDGEYFDWAGGCRIIATPGHMPGHISLYLEESNSVVTGDAAVVEDGELVVANPHFTLDLEKAEESLRKLKDIKADTYYCYHGGAI